MISTFLKWLETFANKRSLIFVICFGSLAYSIAFAMQVSFFIFLDIQVGFLLIPLSSSIIVGFHWFTARFERKSNLAQVIALIPATCLVFLAMGFGQQIVNSQICYVNADTGKLVCHRD